MNLIADVSNTMGQQDAQIHQVRGRLEETLIQQGEQAARVPS